MNRALVSITAIFCLGIVVGFYLRLPLALLIFCLLSLLIFCFICIKKNFLFELSLALLVFLLGASVLVNKKIIPKNHIARQYFYQKESPYIVKGVIASPPEQSLGSMSFEFSAQAIETAGSSRLCCGKILVRMKQNQDLSYGQKLILKGTLYRPFRAQGYREYLYKRRIFLLMNVKYDRDIIRLAKPKRISLVRLAQHFKKKTEAVFDRYCPPITSAVLKAMVLGDKKGIPWYVADMMMKTGTVHILVVSGFNVGIVAFIIIMLLKVLRISRSVRYAVTIPLLIFYCLVTGSSNPVVRATVMAVVFLLGHLLKRQPDIYSSLSIAALLILAFNPFQLFDIGFQLSFSSVIAIIWLKPKIESLFKAYPPKHLRFLTESLLVSVSAWVGTCGFIAYHFKAFSPVTVLANIFVVPLATLITLCGFSLVALNLLSSRIAVLFASTCNLAVFLMLKACSLVLKIPAAFIRL